MPEFTENKSVNPVSPENQQQFHLLKALRAIPSERRDQILNEIAQPEVAYYDERGAPVYKPLSPEAQSLKHAQALDGADYINNLYSALSGLGVPQNELDTMNGRIARKKLKELNPNHPLIKDLI